MNASVIITAKVVAVEEVDAGFLNFEL